MVEKCTTKVRNKKWQIFSTEIFQVAVNETVKHCYRPLVSDCDVEGE